MDRRQYLGAAAAGLAVGVVGVGGYTVLNSDGGGPPPVSTSEYPPYPGAETHELSGKDGTTSDTFPIQNGGPTIVHLDRSDEADGGVPFFVSLESTSNETSQTLVQVRGPYEGPTMVNPEPGEYRLVVGDQGASDPLGWEATVHDVPVYNPDDPDYEDVGLSVPLEYGDGLDAVIGPIDFGDEASTFELSFSIDKETISKVLLFDRKGELVDTLLDERAADSYSRVFPAGGIGYIRLDTNTTWTFGLEPSDEDLPAPNESSNQSDSTNGTAGNDSLNDTTENDSTNGSSGSDSNGISESTNDTTDAN